jgi:hypothetical protein
MATKQKEQGTEAIDILKISQGRAELAVQPLVVGRVSA